MGLPLVVVDAYGTRSDLAENGAASRFGLSVIDACNIIP